MVAGVAALPAVAPVAPLEEEEEVVGADLDDPEGLSGRRGDFDLVLRDPERSERFLEGERLLDGKG